MREIPLFKVYMSPETLQPLNDVLMSGYIGQGEQVDKFEEELAHFIGNPYINTVNSATSALTIAIRMLRGDNYCSDDEVLTTPLTCTATNLPIMANNLRIRWVDVNPDTCNIDTDDIMRKLSPRTKMIVVVHWGGYPCDLDALIDVQEHCQELYGFKPGIIEDCAHAIGSTYKGKLLGNHGNFCCYSFQAIKHLTTCDGGMLVSPSHEFHKKAQLLRWYGLDRTRSADFRCEQNIEFWGYKSHMNDVNAVMGRYNLKQLPEILQRHQENGDYFNESLKDIPGVTLLKTHNDRQSSYWVYTLKVEERDGFIKKMKDYGISVSRVHDRNDKHRCFRDFRCALPNLSKLCKTMICIPCGWWVSDEDREYIVDCIKKGW